MADYDTLPVDEMLYHGTSSKHVRSILSEGLRPQSSWGTLEMARYFAREECRAVGGQPAVFARPIASFGGERVFGIDEGAVDFPMSDIIGVPYDAINQRHDRSAVGRHMSLTGR